MTDLKKPTISIVTVTLNSEKYLENAIRSIANQTYENIEHIIVDGGSSDNTLKIIKKHKDSVARWISEPDKGISDAMNKGIKISTGKYIIFIHSDDYLFSKNSIKEAVRLLNEKYHIYLFRVRLDQQNKTTYSAIRNLGLLTNFKMGSCHQGQICSRELFDNIGMYSTELNITMDYDFLLRAYRAGYSSVSVDKILSGMKLVGISSRTDWKSLSNRFSEERIVHFNNATTLWHRLIYIIYWPLYFGYRKTFFLLKKARKL